MKHLLCTIFLLAILATPTYAESENPSSNQASNIDIAEKSIYTPSNEPQQGSSVKKEISPIGEQSKYEPSFNDFWLYFVLFAPVLLIVVMAIASWRKRKSL